MNNVLFVYKILKILDKVSKFWIGLVVNIYKKNPIYNIYEYLFGFSNFKIIIYVEI